MARPPVEWPIPVYVVELRERVILTFAVPAPRLAPWVPAPVALDTVSGSAVVSLALSNGRCVKPAGGSLTLDSEFHLAELFTPVRWQGACRPPLRGNLLLRLFSDSPGVRRLARAAVGFEAEPGLQEQGTRAAHYHCRLRMPGYPHQARVTLDRSLHDERWPSGSLYASMEAAEAHLLHPECSFIPERTGRHVQAAPVHQYARSTIHAAGTADAAHLVAQALGVHPDEILPDHVLFQKRCTHTWSFPPERIPIARPAPVAGSWPDGYSGG